MISLNLITILRKFLFSIIKVGPIPSHIAFILDGNRRYAAKHNLPSRMGHSAGQESVKTMLQYCYELGVKYVTIYAFSIDNFNRRPEEIQHLMKLLQNAMERLLIDESIANQYGVRVHFPGDLTLLTESVRLTAKRVMEATKGNSKAVLSVCVAYTSTNEILRAVQRVCEDKVEEMRDWFGDGDAPERKRWISVKDVEKCMDLAIGPAPDIIIRTSGETRLSNFLLWQSAGSLLYSPAVVWPEISIWHLVWVVLNFQRLHTYTEQKKKKQL